MSEKPQRNTYCMYRPRRLNGALCQASIPVGETLCADCKKEKEKDNEPRR